MSFGGFCHASRSESKDEEEKLDKYQELAKKLKKKVVEYERDNYTDCKSPRFWKRDSMNWRLKEEMRPARPQHF